jgi:predicted ATPase
MKGCAEAGAELDRPYHLALLAEAHLMAARPAEATAVLERAMAHVSATPTYFYMAEMCRLRGVAAAHCLRASDVVEKWFFQALEVAGSQAALSLQLRSLLSLTDLWTRSGRGDSGRERLASAYARFKEGFETPDLCAADKCLRSFPSEPALGTAPTGARPRSISTHAAGGGR